MTQTVQHGWNQATAAMQHAMGKGLGARASAPRRRRRKAKKAAAPRRARSRRAVRPARLVKGSAAAKRYMASIRRKRG